MTETSNSHFDIITLEPDMWSALDKGVVGRAKSKSIWSLRAWQLRTFSDQSDGRVDDKPYGGDPGMLLAYPPLLRALNAVTNSHPRKPYVVMPVSQSIIESLADQPLITLVCGRYEGVDERFCEHHVDLRVAVGACVVSAGDLPAMMLVDAITRLLPGTLGNTMSALTDSYADNLLGHPSYTRPHTHQHKCVPDVLTQGNHQAIASWQHAQKWARTLSNQPDILVGRTLSASDIDAIKLLQALDSNRPSVADRK